jgi:photosynthetic reaction center cytochrome c subunit
MRLLVVSLTLAMSLTLSAQEEKKKGPNPFANPKNLKVLPAENLQQTMQAFRAGLGVMCSYCHVQGDFASDDNPKKETARMMIHMAMDINAKFPDGKRHVSCYTCHRGETEPKMTPPPAQ